MAIVSDILKQAKSLDLIIEVETLLCDYLKLDKAGLFLAHGQELDSNIEKLLQMNMDSLKDGYPLAYIRGKQDFYGLEFRVSPSVLIPRRETEILVEEAIDCIQKLYDNESGVRMVELGVGSGCISVSVAKNVESGLSILGIEKSREALEIAQENVATHGLAEMIELREGDLFTGVEDDFDVLVANLPYVDPAFDLEKNVLDHEPHVALFADEGGLALYRKVLEQIGDKGFKPQVVLFEIGFDQGGRALQMCKELMSEYDVSIVKDLEYRDRVVKMVRE